MGIGVLPNHYLYRFVCDTGFVCKLLEAASLNQLQQLFSIVKSIIGGSYCWEYFILIFEW